MEKLLISAEERDFKKENPKKTRDDGYIPGVVYGAKSKNRSIKVKAIDFKSVFKKAGESTLIDLEIGGKVIGKTIINDFQVHPLSGAITHFDLYQVRMDQKITTKIPIKFQGESPAVKNDGGILSRVHDKLEIRCLPADLIHEIIIDLSELKKLNDIIRAKDLKVSDKIEIITKPEDTIVIVSPPRTEKELEELQAKVEENVESVEKIVKEKKEGEEEAETAEVKK